MRKDSRDNRIAPRYRVLGHAQIMFRGATTNCVVRDLSESGAKLGVASNVKLPEEFDLWLVQRKLRLRVRLRWRRGEFAGVSFLELQPEFKTLDMGRKHLFVLDG